MDREIDSRN
jgi:hypothetical protein